MSFEQKIQKELDKHGRQWCDAVCPNVARFGKQADRRIAELDNENKALREALEIIAGQRQCVDMTMSNVAIARAALLEKGEKE